MAVLNKSHWWRWPINGLFPVLLISVFGLAAPAAIESDALALERQAREKAAVWQRIEVLRAIDLYLAASDAWSAAQAPLRSSACLREAGKLQVVIDKKPEARASFDKATAIAAMAGDDVEQSKTLSEVGNLVLGSGDLDESQTFLDRALSLAIRSGDASAQATALRQIGILRHFKRDLSGAARSHEEAIEMFRMTLDSAGEASTLTSLGLVYVDQSRYGLAVEVLKRSISISDTLGDLRAKAVALKALGNAYNLFNQKQQALDAYRQAEAMMPKDLERLERAALANGFGSIYEYYGDIELSIAYRKMALSIFREEKHAIGEMATLTSLGRLNSFGTDRLEALDYFLRAGRLAEQLNDRYYQALINEYKGDFYFARGEPGESLRHHLAGLSLLNEGRDARQYSRILRKIGRTYGQKGRQPEAYAILSKSLEINQRVQDGFAEAETLFQMAVLENVSMSMETRLDLAKRSVALTDSLSADVLNSRLQSIYRSNSFDRYALYVRLLMNSHGILPRENSGLFALIELEKARARRTLEALTLSGGRFTADADPTLVSRENELRAALDAKANKLIDALSTNVDKTLTNEIDGQINELRHELEELRAALMRASPVYSAIKNPAVFDSEDFQQNVLDPGSVLLEFSLQKEESYLWTVGKTDFAAYVLPGRDEIERRVEELREMLAARQMKVGESIDEHQRRIAEAEANYWLAAHELSKMLLGQAAEKIRGKRLIVVPDGKLHYFPFSALPLPDATADEPMVLTNEVVYEPSAQTLSLLTKLAKKTTATKDMLIFSDPVFTAEDTRMSGVEVANAPADLMRSDNFRFVESLGSLPRLPGSGAEAESIASIVGSSAVDSFSGFDATRDRLLNTNVTDYKILHFATHGVVNNERPELSGIVMSRYGAAGEQLNEFIRLQDIYGMRLNADLVVLSACETGIGKEVKGEGMMSLNNAFLQSGAKSVLASLWKVEDGASQMLMKEFYSGISDRLTPSEALRGAQIKLARDPRYISPFYWAAFTLQGDLNVRPAIGNGIPVWAYAAASFLILMVGFYLFRLRRGASHLGPTRP